MENMISPSLKTSDGNYGRFLQPGEVLATKKTKPMFTFSPHLCVFALIILLKQKVMHVELNQLVSFQDILWYFYFNCPIMKSQRSRTKLQPRKDRTALVPGRFMHLEFWSPRTKLKYLVLFRKHHDQTDI